LFQRGFDKGPRVSSGCVGIWPGQPLAQIDTIPVNQRKKLLGVALFKEAKFDVIINHQAEHKSPPKIAF
jgi:hypothetical protein